MGVDAAFETAKRVLDDAKSNLANIRTEEDAKIQIITRIVIEVLGWLHSDISAEHQNANGFSDYELGDNDRPYLVVEAKKIGALDLATHSTSMGHYKISGPVLKPAFEGINQAARYCHPRGIQLAVLTDGCAWIVFLPWVPQTPFTERQAVVFPTMDAILDEFATFYELLSKSELKRSRFRVVFDQIHENRLVLDRPLEAAIPVSENSRVSKSALAFDLENVFSKFFSGLTGEDDPAMLIDCFVETRESRVADFSLEKITRNVLGNINPDERGIEHGLQTIVTNTVAGDDGQTIFIVGPSGAGKSTFLDIDALDASGDENTALLWTTNRAIELIEGQIFEDGVPSWNDLQGLYHSEYIRRIKGVDAQLYARSKDEFKEKFAKHVEELVERDREGYLKRLLKDIVTNRKKLPLFVVDNTDEFSASFKSSVFQYFQALRRAADHCILIFPVTDKSAWAFSKTDIYNIYSSRSFFLPTPSPREVFRKRIEYLKDKLATTSSGRKQGEYFVGRGIRINIADLTAFASVVESIFVDQDYAAKRLGELSNYNMRQTLSLSKRIVTSAVLRIEELIQSYITGAWAAPSPARFMNALLKGDYELFRAGDEPLLLPLFQVDSTVRQSPLIHMRLLILLRDRHLAAADDIHRYMAIGSVFAFCDLMGMSETAVQASIEMLLASGLIEPYDPSKKDFSSEQQIAVTHSGLAHLDLGMFNPVFFEQQALTTRIVDADVAAQIKGANRSTRSIDGRLEDVRRLFSIYLADEDGRLCTVPETSEFKNQRHLAGDLVRQWSGSVSTSEQMLKISDLAAEMAAAVVERFDPEKGYGFVEVPSLRDQAFLHARVLEQSGFGDVLDGDDLVCDVIRTEKGLSVSVVHEVRQPPQRTYKAEIVKLLPERRYGFMSITELALDAFFHYHLFPSAEEADLAQGQAFLVEIKTDAQSRSQVRRIVHRA